MPPCLAPINGFGDELLRKGIKKRNMFSHRERREESSRRPRGSQGSNINGRKGLKDWEMRAGLD